MPLADNLEDDPDYMPELLSEDNIDPNEMMEDGDVPIEVPYEDYARDDDDPIDGVGFADPYGHSALRAATAENPRNLPCPTCNQPDKLTPLDVARGYQCDDCADVAEGRGGY